MINRMYRTIGIGALFSISIFSTQAMALPDPAAPLVKLSTDCGSNNNCFTDTTALLDWIWNTRLPSASNPLILDIDPGTYVLPNTMPFCPGGNGHLTVRGSGRNNTVLTGGGGSGSLGVNGRGVIEVFNCDDLAFQDLTIRADTLRGIPFEGVESTSGVAWSGAGSSTWNNVEVEGNTYGWVDAGCDGSLHYFYGSKVSGTAVFGNEYGIFGYFASCGEHWFYGGEILAFNDAPGMGYFGGVSAVYLTGNAMMQVFGGSLRSLSGVNGAYAAVHSQSVIGQNGMAVDGATGHMHGGIISVVSKRTGWQDVTGVAAMNGGSIHTPGTAFTLIPSNNSAGTKGIAKRIRILNPELGTTVNSPYQWPAGETLPASSPLNLISDTGQDSFIETDCAPSGCTVTDPANPTEPHLLIYSTNCATAGPWFDVVTGSCRGD